MSAQECYIRRAASDCLVQLPSSDQVQSRTPMRDTKQTTGTCIATERRIEYN